jgi:hypothetical protein
MYLANPCLPRLTHRVQIKMITETSFRAQGPKKEEAIRFTPSYS